MTHLNFRIFHFRLDPGSSIFLCRIRLEGLWLRAFFLSQRLAHSGGGQWAGKRRDHDLKRNPETPILLFKRDAATAYVVAYVTLLEHAVVPPPVIDSVSWLMTNAQKVASCKLRQGLLMFESHASDYTPILSVLG